MSLAAGSRIGCYEVLGILGAGGMGEVFRARDTKLGREVALKVLPEIFASDADRLARFQREAQLLASLNHSNIGSIYGLEDGAGVRALVLELIEGETLADRIRRGPLTVDEALGVARQIADALEAAHERGVIHRDLKPANVKVTPDGKVKVLDFGLAKAMDAAPSAPHVSHSPTLSLAGTVAGMVLGTAAYMSPEQAKGLPADQRSDVFSFGCVLYEMLVGRQAFQADTAAESLAAVLMRSPELSALPATVPPRLRALVQRCLEKDPKRRWHAVGDLRYELEAIAVDPHAATLVAPAAAAGASTPMPWWRRAQPIAATAVIVAVAASAATWWSLQSTRPPTVARFRIPLDEDGNVPTLRNGIGILALSPDGQTLVYAGNRQLHRRSLAELEAHSIPGTELDVAMPFFSPGGDWIAFVSVRDGSLRKIAISGGSPITICNVGGLVLGASWFGDSIVFAQSGKGILRVAAAGGVPEVIVAIAENEVADTPQLIDGGRAVLFTLAGGAGTDRWDKAQIVVQSIGSTERQVVVRGGSDARLLPSGHLLYMQGGTILAAPFDTSKRTVTGGPVPMVEGVMRATNSALSGAVTHFATSTTGTLVYLPGVASEFAVPKTLAFADREGKVSPLGLPLQPYVYPRISPDGTQLVVVTDDGREASLWVADLKGGGPLRRLTFRGRNHFPIWSRDGRFIIYQSDQDGDGAIFRVRADGGGAPERLTTPEQGARHEPESLNPAGDILSFNMVRGPNQGVWIWPFTGDRKPASFVDSPETEKHSVFSPNGKWIAYMKAALIGASGAATAGGTAVFVEPFPATGAKYEVGSGGARTPLWSPDGRELYYHDQPSNRFNVVDVRTEPSFSTGRPTTLPIQGTIHPVAQRNYDVTPDGKQLIVVLPASPSGSASARAEAPQITVVLNWFEELKARVPVK
jgi:serine/threonine-protein kinase